MEALHRRWHWVLATQAAPPGPVIAALAVAAAALVLLPRAWLVTRHVVTIVHEGAHGLAALLTGRRLSGIRLHSDTSGVTVSVGRPAARAWCSPLPRRRRAGPAGPRLPHCSVPDTWSRCCGRSWSCWPCCWHRSATGSGSGRSSRARPSSWPSPGCRRVRPQSAFASSWPGSCCCRLLARCSSCRRSAAATVRAAPTRTSWRGSPECPGWSWVGVFLAVSLGSLVTGARWLLDGIA